MADLGWVDFARTRALDVGEEPRSWDRALWYRNGRCRVFTNLFSAGNRLGPFDTPARSHLPLPLPSQVPALILTHDLDSVLKIQLQVIVKVSSNMISI